MVMNIREDEKLALFIDGANLYAAARALGFDIDYKRLLDTFGGRGRLARALYYTALVEEFEATDDNMDTAMHKATQLAVGVTERIDKQLALFKKIKYLFKTFFSSIVWIWDLFKSCRSCKAKDGF